MVSIIKSSTPNYKRVFPNLNARKANEMHSFLERSGLPMVNAGARTDINLLVLSGAKTGLFVEERYLADYLKIDLESCADVSELLVEGREVRLGDRPIEQTHFTFTHDDKEKYQLDYYVTDALIMDDILGKRPIGLYYSAVQFGPEMIPDSAFDNLVEGGYLITPYRLGHDERCFALTGLKRVADLNFNEIYHIRDPFDAYLYRKTRSVPPVQTTISSPGLLAFCYLTGILPG